MIAFGLLDDPNTGEPGGHQTREQEEDRTDPTSSPGAQTRESKSGSSKIFKRSMTIDNVFLYRQDCDDDTKCAVYLQYILLLPW